MRLLLTIGLLGIRLLLLRRLLTILLFLVIIWSGWRTSIRVLICFQQLYK